LSERHDGVITSNMIGHGVILQQSMTMAISSPSGLLEMLQAGAFLDGGRRVLGLLR